MFGKLARVRLTRKNVRDEFEIEMPVISLDSPAPSRKKEKKQEPKKEVKEAPKAEQAEKPADEPKPERKKKSRKEKKAEPAANVEVLEPAPAEEEAPFVVTPEEEMTEETKSSRDFLKNLTEKMGVPAEIEVCQGDETLRMKMSGENMSILIGRRGETLDAIQYLTSLNVNRGREKYLRVNIDTENYRSKREEALRKLAVRMAARAKKSGRRVALEPMNPYERRILHSALQNDPAVATHSEGEEPYRRVIITLK